jgi:hypothetical protein
MIPIASWYIVLGSEITFNTVHEEYGIRAGAFLAYFIVLVMIGTYYFSIHLATQHEFLHVLV